MSDFSTTFEMTDNSSLSLADNILSSSVGAAGSGMYTLFGTIAVIIALVTIFVLVKSILDRKKIKAELSLKTIKSVKTTSIILIVITALSVITNCFAILLLIMPIISVVFTSKAQKLLESEFDLAKSKVNTANILNISSAILSTVEMTDNSSLSLAGNISSSSVGAVGSGMYTLLETVAGIIALVTIFVLVKSILDRKKIKAELSLKTINSVETTSIILIVINALFVITNGSTNSSAILLLIMPIISAVFTSEAQKLLESEFDLAKSKVNTASILNIISAILPIVKMTDNSSSLAGNILISSIDAVGSGMYTLLEIIAVIIALATIFVLVKSILDRKKIKAELSLKTINSIKITSIILIVINALFVITDGSTNSSAILLLSMPIISAVFTSKAQKLLESEFDLAKSKVNTASILNIGLAIVGLINSAILPIVRLILTIVGWIVIGVLL